MRPMRRKPRPSLVTTTLPALATLLGACQSSGPRYAPNPPPPHDPPPPPAARDAGGALVLEPIRIDPDHIPNIPLAGAPMPVTPMPPMPAPSPAPAPSASAPMAAPAPAPMAAAPAPSGAAEGLAPGLWVVHNHPPGTPCRPISQTELQQALQRSGR